MNEFEKYALENVLKGKYIHEAADFVRGMLSGTKNGTMYTYALSVAEAFKDEDSDYIWTTILNAFNNIIKGKNKPPWASDFVYRILRHSSIKLSNYNIHLIVTMILTYDGEFNTFQIDTLTEKPWFEEMKYQFSDAIIKNLDKIPPRNLPPALNAIKDMRFYKDILEKTTNGALFAIVIGKIRFFHKDIDGFIGGFDIVDILKKFGSKLIDNRESMINLSDMMDDYPSTEAYSLFIKILNDSAYSETDQIRWLQKFEDSKSIEVDAKLFELTGDEKYLSEEAKDIFVF